jgi:hypothetical protein
LEEADAYHSTRLFEKAVRPPPFIQVLTAAWLAAVGFGFHRAWRYEATPGRTAAVRPGDRVTHSDSARLLVFAHPRCVCSEATVEELGRLLRSLPEADGSRPRLETEVFFFRPSGEPDEWAHTRLWDQAAALPGVRVRVDPGGQQALRRGLTTSGHTLLFDAAGKLEFSGGITGARGVAGDNRGWNAARARILEEVPGHEFATAPVFGCSLLTPETKRSGGRL